MWPGIGLGACALWSLVYIAPLALGDYDPLFLTLGRAAVMGSAALVGQTPVSHGPAKANGKYTLGLVPNRVLHANDAFWEADGGFRLRV